MANEMIERTFPVAGKASLKLSNISGSVNLQPGAAGEIRVQATKLENTGNAERTEIEMEQSEDGQVKVSTRFPEGFLGFLGFNSPCAVDYQVFLPPDCVVRASGVSSSVAARGLSGALEFSTVSGDLSLKDLSGSVSASTVSGDLEGSEVHAALHAKTVSGDLRLAGSFSSVDANSVSGNIHLDTATLGDGPYQFKSVSGNIHMDLHQDVPFRLEHRSISGEIITNMPVARSTKQPGSQRVEIGSGGPLITSNSVSGNLRVTGPGGPAHVVQAEEMPEESHHSIHHVPPVPPVRPVPPVPPSEPKGLTPEERQEILEKIEKGEISVEDALQALSSK